MAGDAPGRGSPGDGPLALIVGLGNPGAEYADSRHNAGFWLVDELARRYGGTFRAEQKFSGEACRVTVDSHPVWLLKPLTFMNRSGLSVAQLCRFYKIAAGDLLVAHDELDLPPGEARLKSGGGHGGHNGLRDLHKHLGGGEFLRLRIGIGHPGAASQVVNYVLHRPSRAERVLIDGAVDEALRVLPLLFGDDRARGLAAAMNRLHQRRVPVDADVDTDADTAK